MKTATTIAAEKYQDSRTFWFVRLETARERQDFERAAEAVRELRRLGVDIRFFKEGNRMIAPIETSVTKLLLTKTQAAEAMSCCERTISRLVTRGELHAISIGNRGIRISVDELRQWIAKQQEVSK